MIFGGTCSQLLNFSQKNDSEIKTLQTDLEKVGVWVAENAIKINPGKSKAVSFTRVRVKGCLNYFFGYQRILEASSCKYLGIILCSDISWADQVNYTVQKGMKGTSFHNACS